MKFEKSKPIRVEIYGKEVFLSNPTYGQVKELSVGIKNDPTSSQDLTEKFLSDIGLPSDVMNEMEAEHIVSLCQFITSKKN